MDGETSGENGCCGGRKVVDPIEACTLSAEELAQRIRWIRAEIVPHSVGRERLEDSVAIEIVEAPGTGETVDRWIELERECCGEIRWDRRPSEIDGQIRVEIRRVDPDGVLFEGLPLLAGGSTTKATSPGQPLRFGRLLKAGGFGVGVSYLVCCVLPVGLAAALGRPPWPHPSRYSRIPSG